MLHKKTSSPRYGRRHLARALGFSSAAGLNMILIGQRELRPPYLHRTAKIFDFSPAEQLYFEAMVNARLLTPAKRLELKRKADLLCGVWKPPEDVEGIRIFDFFVIHQILCLYHRPVSIADIQRCFRYPISTQAIETNLHWMLQCGYIRDVNGLFKIVKSTLSPKDEFPNVSLRRMHIDAFKLAESALDQDAIENREFQTFLFTINRTDLPAIKKRLKVLSLKIISEFETDLDASTVVQMHLNLFEAVATPRE